MTSNDLLNRRLWRRVVSWKPVCFGVKTFSHCNACNSTLEGAWIRGLLVSVNIVAVRLSGSSFKGRSKNSQSRLQMAAREKEDLLAKVRVARAGSSVTGRRELLLFWRGAWMLSVGTAFHVHNKWPLSL